MYLPLVDQLKGWAIKELNEAEQTLARKGMDGIRVVETFVAKQVEEVASGNCCRPKPKAIKQPEPQSQPQATKL